jgi:hypothetical protein
MGVDQAEAEELEPADEPTPEDAGEEGRSSASVLVAIMNNRRDWELVHTQHWYRVPVRRAPAQVAADYLAFYQTAAFRDEKWTVSYYAPVSGVRIALRRELLPAEPGHPRAGELYYRFGLGPLEALEHPVGSRRVRRLTFIHTTLELLLNARDIQDLWTREPLRERLWVEMNRQGVHAARGPVLAEGAALYACDFCVPCYAGAVLVECPAELSPGGTPRGVRDSSEYLEMTGEPLRAPAERCSRLHFEDGAAGELSPCLAAIWQEIAARGGQM